MEFVIPLQFNPQSPEYLEIEVLNPDMWKDEITENDIYLPKDPLTGNTAYLNLHSFMTKIMELKSDFSFYLGSATTPPCQGKI